MKKYTLFLICLFQVQAVIPVPECILHWVEVAKNGTADDALQNSVLQTIQNTCIAVREMVIEQNHITHTMQDFLGIAEQGEMLGHLKTQTDGLAAQSKNFVQDILNMKTGLGDVIQKVNSFGLFMKNTDEQMKTLQMGIDAANANAEKIQQYLEPSNNLIRQLNQCPVLSQFGIVVGVSFFFNPQNTSYSWMMQNVFRSALVSIVKKVLIESGEVPLSSVYNYFMGPQPDWVNIGLTHASLAAFFTAAAYPEWSLKTAKDGLNLLWNPIHNVFSMTKQKLFPTQKNLEIDKITSEKAIPKDPSLEMDVSQRLRRLKNHSLKKMELPAAPSTQKSFLKKNGTPSCSVEL